MPRPYLCVAATALVAITAACGDKTAAPAAPAADTAAKPAPNAPVQPAASAPQPAPPARHAHSNWAGRWIGVEGMFVDILPTEPGKYQLRMMASLDDPTQDAEYPGHDVADGIAFTREDGQYVLRAATGDQIGLKWLDGKKDCLMVQDGEGFCRD